MKRIEFFSVFVGATLFASGCSEERAYRPSTIIEHMDQFRGRIITARGEIKAVASTQISAPDGTCLTIESYSLSNGPSQPEPSLLTVSRSLGRDWCSDPVIDTEFNGDLVLVRGRVIGGDEAVRRGLSFGDQFDITGQRISRVGG